MIEGEGWTPCCSIKNCTEDAELILRIDGPPPILVGTLHKNEIKTILQKTNDFYSVTREEFWEVYNYFSFNPLLEKLRKYREHE
jgi:hypothetical protein